MNDFKIEVLVRAMLGERFRANYRHFISATQSARPVISDSSYQTLIHLVSLWEINVDSIRGYLWILLSADVTKWNPTENRSIDLEILDRPDSKPLLSATEKPAEKFR
jgi:hypothetical protein